MKTRTIAPWIKRAALTDPRGDYKLARDLGVTVDEIRALRDEAAAPDPHIVHRGYGGTPPRRKPPAPR
ncbi:hypothetical protein [Solirubrobacter soli]|uniref:hypothetical protein n=1 Tax=Solirubrobacter soli TaxID=363832 RepID=UPI000414516D|nr:hypothetical protein [Solirubrobacter soli]